MGLLDVQAFRLFVKTVAGVFFMAIVTMSAVAQNTVLYATDGSRCTPSILYQLNPADGSIINIIGPTGVSGMTGLASHPLTGVMYGITTGGAGCTSNLYTVDLSSGTATLVGPLGTPSGPGGQPPGKPDAAFSPAGVLYTFSTADDFIYTVDLATGAASLVGDTTLTPFDISQAVDGGTLVMTDGASVYTVDTSTGVATLGPPLGIGVNDSNMSTTNSVTGQMYLGDRDGASRFDLYTLDPSTGAMVLLGGNTIGRMSAIEILADLPPPPSAAIPTMTAYSLLLLVLGLLVVATRRLRASAPE
jgi:hypothetical protein